MGEPDLLQFAQETESHVRDKKSPTALRTISEASEILDVPQHVLRFWETKFLQIRPMKRNGGRRFYRPEDMEVLQHIKFLLYKQGYTIKGAIKAIEEFSKIVDSTSASAHRAEWAEPVLKQAENDNSGGTLDSDFSEANALQQELLTLRANLAAMKHELAQALRV